jgi:hypothetical protein
MSDALRLTFEYTGRKVELVSSEPVDAVVPASAVEPTDEPGVGLWLHLRDGRGERVHSRLLHDPTRDHVEFADAPEPDRPFSNEPAPERSGRFSVLVPALDDASEVELVGADHAADEPERSRSLGRFRVPRHGEPRGGA